MVQVLSASVDNQYISFEYSECQKKNLIQYLKTISHFNRGKTVWQINLCCIFGLTTHQSIKTYTVQELSWSPSYSTSYTCLIINNLFSEELCNMAGFSHQMFFSLSQLENIKKAFCASLSADSPLFIVHTVYSANCSY